MKMNLPNKLTIARIILAPFSMIFILYAVPNETWARIFAASLFLLTAVTDLIDGKLARKFGWITNFGKFMDPLADKVLVMAAMCYLVEIGQMPGWCLAIVLLREFAVSGMRLVAVEQGRVIAAAWSGKVKTASTMVCLCAMLLNVFGAYAWFDPLCNAVIVLTTAYSGIEYFIKNADVFREPD